MLIHTTQLATIAATLAAGDEVLLTGEVYAARDAAHKRMCEALSRGEPLPFDIRGQIIYYMGPAPAKPGRVIGPCGPTTACRCDLYTPALIERGLLGMIGKGDRGDTVIEAMKAHGCVYFAAVGGAAALIARSVTKVEPVAYEDMGTEAITRLSVENFPVIVAIDSRGNNLYRH